MADKNRLVPFWEGCVGGGDSLLFLSCREQSAELRGGTRAAVTRSPLPAQGSQIPRVLPQNHWLGCPCLPLAKLDRWSQHPRWGHPSCCPAPLPACAPFFFFFFHFATSKSTKRAKIRKMWWASGKRKTELQGRGGPEPPARSVEHGVPQGSAWFGFCCFSALLHGFSLFHLFLTLVFSTLSLLKLVCWYLYRSLRLCRSIPTEPVYSIRICICRYMYMSCTYVCIYENKIPSLHMHTLYTMGRKSQK